MLQAAPAGQMAWRNTPDASAKAQSRAVCLTLPVDKQTDNSIDPTVEPSRLLGVLVFDRV